MEELLGKVFKELSILADETLCLFFVNFEAEPSNSFIDDALSLEIYLRLFDTIFPFVDVEQDICSDIINEPSFDFGDGFEDDFEQIADISIEIVLDFGLRPE